MTIIDCCISLKMIKNILVVLGVVDMRQLLLKINFTQKRSDAQLKSRFSESATKFENVTHVYLKCVIF